PAQLIGSVGESMSMAPAGARGGAGSAAPSAEAIGRAAFAGAASAASPDEATGDAASAPPSAEAIGGAASAASPPEAIAGAVPHRPTKRRRARLPQPRLRHGVGAYLPWLRPRERTGVELP